MEVEAGKIVDEWRIEEQAIESIEHAAMAWQNVRGVLCPAPRLSALSARSPKIPTIVMITASGNVYLSGSSRKNQK